MQKIDYALTGYQTKPLSLGCHQSKGSAIVTCY